MMQFKDLIKEIESKKEFKEWKNKHNDFYLVHAFVMMDEANKDTWQIGYYHKEDNKMVTIVKQGGKIDFVPEQGILKASEEIHPLNPEEIKITPEEAIDTAKECIKKHYQTEPVIKYFFILQHFEGETIYNITYITNTFKTINIKVSAIDGKIIKHSCEKLADFG